MISNAVESFIGNISRIVLTNRARYQLQPAIKTQLGWLIWVMPLRVNRFRFLPRRLSP